MMIADNVVFTNFNNARSKKPFQLNCKFMTFACYPECNVYTRLIIYIQVKFNVYVNVKCEQSGDFFFWKLG